MNSRDITLDEELEVYLFRFREHPKPWEPGEGWMAGIAGPYRNGDRMLSPMSAFDRWDEKSPQEHFERLLPILCEGDCA